LRRFVYRFRRVLDAKKSLEEAQKVAVGEALTVLTREQEALARLTGESAATMGAARDQPAAVLDTPLLNLNSAYMQRLEREIAEQRKHVSQVEAIVTARRAQLVEARRERRVFEILQEKAREAHKREESRQQQRQLDETGERLHARQKGGARGGGN
jgi:flagellar protein FliJ